MFLSADPVRDWDRFTAEMDKHAAAVRRERAEHFIGTCPICGEPMYDDDYSYSATVVYDYDHFNGEVHELCLRIWKEDEECEEA